MPRRVATAALAALVAVGTLATVLFADIGGTLFFASYAGTGAFLVVRRPRNVIGWLLIATGTGLSLGTVRPRATPEQLLAGGLDPLTTAVAWANGWVWGLVFVAITALTLVFPSGSLPSGRAAWGARLVLGAVALAAALVAIAPSISVTPAPTGVPIDVPNPIAVLPEAGIWAAVPGPDGLFALMGIPFAAGIVALAARYRATGGIERLQYRWLVAAFVVVTAATAAWAVATQLLDQDQAMWDILAGIAYPLVPAAIAIAVLRYRLYEIDRIVSRSIGWAIVTGCLLAAFAGGVVALQALLSGITQGQTLAVAASTLAVFALFQPVRRRVQSVVDRRFDRARYDAQRTVDVFAEEIRHDVDLGAVRAGLLATTRDAVRPAGVALWLRAGGERGR